MYKMYVYGHLNVHIGPKHFVFGPTFKYIFIHFFVLTFILYHFKTVFN